ncbi:DUF2087 domain-containing protein [Lutispora saccharofermentans]|uniref:DUF2087 domain-containing protein n=1 Tax=Lutispora saccharofermentans TaxID=3024236 RepID=A0ABT1NKB4_9FIRM|nr:DUF2087 domain-containing protein [Lutispora saccharofermentans]MCQ1531707.1 DUF2087 domain-containing protein [Lutispora saccharofermentans]
MSKTRKEVNMSAFLDEDGKIKQWPASSRAKTAVLAYLAGKFEKDRIYNEKEVNGIINSWHTFGDYFILRRSLIDYKFLGRTANGAEYWVTAKEDEKEGDS